VDTLFKALKNVSIIAYLGSTVKEYSENGKSKLAGLQVRCPKHPAKILAFHDTYKRTIKETGEKVVIHILVCHKCGYRTSVLPDFLLPHKHYSANEIEAVIMQAADGVAVYDIETPASVSTVRRWLGEMNGEGGKLREWVSGLKTLAIAQDCAISEITMAELPFVEQLREFVHALPKIRFSGNLLGFAGIYLSGRSP
jgi:hypothetical protein